MKFTKSEKTKVERQQLVLPMQSTSTVQVGNDGAFNETVDVVDFPANEADYLPPTSVTIHPEEEDML